MIYNSRYLMRQKMSARIRELSRRYPYEKRNVSESSGAGQMLLSSYGLKM